MGEMWCFQKPGFEALLLTELQRQQQCSQFCDTVLQTEGVSVPAHSCILSAISPRISSTLSSMPPLPAGQSRLLEFQAVRDCTMLNMVRLLYSGEMAGEGAKEKQEAISTAAKLGIHGLVEVTKRGCKSRNEEVEGQHAEVGVQTEPVMLAENEGRGGWWRREVRDGSTFLWKETLSEGGKDTWTQTEELQVNTAPTFHPAASFETVDMAALQSLGQTDPHLLPLDIPFVPISLIYPPDENQTPQLSSAPPLQEPTAAGHTSGAVVAPPPPAACPSLHPLPSQAARCAADPQSWWSGPQEATTHVAAAEEWDDKQLEQFQGNIPGYINHFLNPDKKEGSRRGRPRKRQGVGGARRARTGERRARTPRARRGGLMQTVDVQEVGLSKLQKLFLQRWRMAPSRTGQGGGAVGRKLHLKTRELLKPASSCQRRRRLWEFSGEDGLPVGRPQRARAKPVTSVCFSSPPMPFYNVHTLSTCSPSFQPTPSHRVLPPGASYVSSASSFLHTTSLPPLASAPPEEQSKHLDCLVEEVMMGLNFLPNNDGALYSQPPTSSSSCDYVSSGSTLALNKQQGSTIGTLEAGRGFHGSSSGNSEVQQGQGELNEVLEHFLQYFEQHVDSCSAGEEVEIGSQSCTEASQPYTALRKHRKTKTQTTSPRLQNTCTPHPVRCSDITELQHNGEAETQPRRSQPHKHKASACSAVPPKHIAGTPGEVRASAKQRRRRKNQCHVPASDEKINIVHDRGDKQLQKIPMVQLERSGPLPFRVSLPGLNCQSLEFKIPAKTYTSSSSVKYPHGSLSDKNETVSQSTNTYPTRSRFRKAHITNTVPFLVEPLVHKQPPVASGRPGRPRKNGQLVSLSNGESATPTIQPQPVDGQLGKHQEKHEEELTVQPQEDTEGPTRRGKKRGAESEQQTSDDAAVAKRVCLEQMAQPTSETCIPSSESAVFVSNWATIETEDAIDVETVLVTSVGDCFKREELTEKPVWSEIKLTGTGESLMDEEMQSSGGHTIKVDGGVEDGRRHSRTTLSHLVEMSSSISPPSHSAKEVSLGSRGSLEEDTEDDIDVAGAASPVPDPVIISWAVSSGGEEEEKDEDVDVVG